MDSISENSRYTKISIWLTPVIAVIFTFLFGIGIYRDAFLSKSLDHLFYDTFTRILISEKASDRITIVDIDETSLSEIGQWPWPRYRVAQIIEKISDLKPQTIGFDIVLPEQDRTSLSTIQDRFQKDFGLQLIFSGVPGSLTDNDAYLAYMFRQSPVVGARYFYFDHYNKENPCFYSPFDILDTTGKLQLHSAKGILCNTPGIENALQVTGFTNTQNDEDGIIRKTPLMMTYKDQIFTHFSLSIFLELHGLDHAVVLKDPLGFYIKAGRFKIPIDREGYAYMLFPGPARQFNYISALDILNNSLSPGMITDRIVLIGSSAVGLNDVHHTVYDAVFPGVEINAAILDNMMDNRLVIKPDWSQHAVFLLSLLTGIIMTLPMFRWDSPMRLVLVSLVWISTILGSSGFLFSHQHIFISPGHPILLTLLYFSLFSFLRFVQTRQDSFMWFKKLARSQQLTMEAMVSLVETRDPETGQHIVRTQHYGKQIAIYLKKEGHFTHILTDEYIDMLFLSIPLHDIGKVGIPDRILLKPGKLTEDEFKLMKRHTTIGKKTIQRATKNIKDNDYLTLGAEIAGAHHERWDGKGYPQELSGDGIPLSARIMAIADVYDALISRRCYKEPFSHEKAMTLILEGKGTMFDPRIVEAFIQVETEIKAIALKFNDEINYVTDHMEI